MEKKDKAIGMFIAVFVILIAGLLVKGFTDQEPNAGLLIGPIVLGGLYLLDYRRETTVLVNEEGSKVFLSGSVPEETLKSFEEEGFRKKR